MTGSISTPWQANYVQKMALHVCSGWMQQNQIISIANQKGGVGKTTSSHNIAKVLASKGHKILLVDNDPQGNATRVVYGDEIPELIVNLKTGKPLPGTANTYSLYKGIEVQPHTHTENISVIGSSKHLAEMSTSEVMDIGFEFQETLKAISDDFDYTIIDCLPSFGSMLTAALMASDYVLIPTILDDFAADGVDELVLTINKIKKRLNPDLKILGVIISQIDGRDVLVERHFKEELEKKFGDKVLKSYITQSIKVCEANAFQQAVFEYNNKLEQAKQYDALTDEILIQMGA